MKDDQKKYLVPALRGVWQYIGNDIMQAVEESGGNSIPRDHVVELVLDRLDSVQAHIVRTTFGSTGTECDRAKEVLKEFMALSYDDKISLTIEAFPWDQYA